MSRASQTGLPEIPPQVLLAGFGQANRAAARALTARGHTVTALDDRYDDAAVAAANELGLELAIAPTPRHIAELVGAADIVVPTPGLPHCHGVLAAAVAYGVPTASEFDLARAWDSRPIAGVTGTSGKTTTTEVIVAALEASGIRSLAAGNNDTPLVAAIERPDVEVFVAEASSFRLAHSRCFEPRAACWLNFAPDHLDVHRDLAAYEAAKARIWGCLPAEAVAIANREDPTVMGRVRDDRCTWTFATRGPADWRREGDMLVGPRGPVIDIGELHRAMPHDLANALAAAATATAVGASAEGIRTALRAFEPGAHRLQWIASIDGVDFYDDSKATTPHATVAALFSFEAAVLIAGGRNKGIDLRGLLDAAERVHAVVAIGEAAQEVSDVFERHRPVRRAVDMREAVRIAASLAEPGMAVLLSPACASFDAYRSYAERGDDFARIVTEAAGRPPPGRVLP